MLNINCNNIKDFCELISISVGQGIEKQCVFVSSKVSYPSVAVATTPKNHNTFTFAFFTPLYTAIYKGNIKSDIFSKEYDLLKETCSKHQLYIHTFDKLKYNSDDDCLYLENHIDTI